MNSSLSSGQFEISIEFYIRGGLKTPVAKKFFMVSEPILIIYGRTLNILLESEKLSNPSNILIKYSNS